MCSNRSFRKNHRNNLIYPCKDLIWVAPELIAWLLLFGLPFSFSIISSFYSDDAKNVFEGFKHYYKIFGDSYFFLSLKNTYIFLGFFVLLVMTASTLIAHLLFSKTQSRWILIPLLLPLFFPSPAIASIWKVLFGKGSWIVSILKARDEPWKYFVLLVLMFWKTIGAAALVYYIELRKMDTLILDAASIDGVTGRKAFIYIELPQLKQISVYVVFFLAVNVIRIFRESYMLYGAYPPRNLFFLQHYIYLHYVRLNYGTLSAAGTVFSFIMLVLLALPTIIMARGDAK